MALELMGGILLVLLLLNAWTTRFVLRDELSTENQRIAQVAFVWLLPLVGALLAIYLKRKEPESSSGRYQNVPDAGDDFGGSGQSYRSIQQTVEADGSGGGGGAASD